MNRSAEQLTISLETVPVPRKMLDARLDSDEVIEARDAFFEAVKQQFETKVSHGMLEGAFKVRHVVSPPLRGNGDLDTDVSDELTLKHGQPVAFALQTREFEQNVVQFGVIQLNKIGRRALAGLIEADTLINNIAFRG